MDFVKFHLKYLLYKKRKNLQVRCYIIDFIVYVSYHFLQFTLHCSCFISFPLVHTLLFMFHFISFSPQSISFISSTTVHLILTFTLFGCTHITSSFNLIVSFTFQLIPSLEIKDLRVFLDKVLILDRHSLFEAEFRWLYYSLSLYIKQEIQNDVRAFCECFKVWWIVLGMNFKISYMVNVSIPIIFSIFLFLI